jgi:hypothetical protein
MNKQDFKSKVHTLHHMELRDRHGVLKWEEDFHNVVTTEGMDHILDATFKSGSVEPDWYLGLVDGAETPAFLAADTMLSHVGWVENVLYTEDMRQAFTPGEIADGAVDNTGARAVFTIGADGTIAGCFLVNDGVKEATDGILYGVGAFTGGGRPVEEGDTLRVTTTLTVTE